MLVTRLRRPSAGLLHRRDALATALLATLLAATGARAAELTDVADAFDEQKPFQFDLGATYGHRSRSTKITRETQGVDASSKPAIVLVDELQSTESSDQIEFRLAIGLYKDLEVHASAPLFLTGQQTWDYVNAGGTNSTLKNNHLSISGCAAAGSCSQASPATPIVAAPGISQRGGFGDPTFGLTIGLLNQEREAQLQPDQYPRGLPVATWVLGLDYTAPLFGDLDDPSKYGLAAGGTSTTLTGTWHRKAHVLSPFTAFSKRFSVADPYVQLRATLPFATGDAYDNCAQASKLADVAPQNCALAAWKGETGYQPSYTATFTVGSEFVFSENPEARRKFSFDLRGDATWFSPGRNYTQVTDPLGKLTYEEEHLQLLGTFGVHGRAASWLHFRVAGQLGLDTAHFLTTEAIGKDLNGDGVVTLSAGASPKSQEQSPTFDFRLDQPGHRLHAELAVLWGFSGSLWVEF